MKIKGVVTATTTMMLLFSLVVPTFAQTDKVSSAQTDKVNDYVVGTEAMNFLTEHKVDVLPFKKSNLTNDKMVSQDNSAVSISKSASYDEQILSIKRQAAANQFSDDQIQKYVKGLVDTSPIVINSPSSTSISTLSTPYSTRIGDDGIGYEVKSTSGFNEETAYATIPTAFRATATSGYMFNTISSPTTGFGIDVGLWYGAGGATGDVVGWRGVYNGPTGQHAVPSDGSIISALTPGKQVYMIWQIRSDGYLETKVLDANNFSTVYLDFIYYVGDKQVYTSNGIFNRQITLCQGSAVFTNGSYMRNAKFSQGFLYSNTGYSKVNSLNTDSNRRGAFIKYSSDLSKVLVNAYTQWDSEDVSINFTP